MSSTRVAVAFALLAGVMTSVAAVAGHRRRRVGAQTARRAPHRRRHRPVVLRSGRPGALGHRRPTDRLAAARHRPLRRHRGARHRRRVDLRRSGGVGERRGEGRELDLGRRLRAAADSGAAALPGRSAPRPALVAVGGHLRRRDGLLAVGSAAYPGPVAQAVFLLGAGLLVPSCIAGLAAVVVRWRRSDGLVRRQVAVLLVTATILVVDILLQPLLGWPLGALTQAVAVALVPAGIAVAVTRHRLYDLDLAVCRAIGGLSLAVCLAAIYVSLFLIASAVLPGGPTVGAATAAAVTRAAASSARRATQPRRRPDVLRRPRRSRAGPRGDRFGLREGLDLAEVPGRVCQVVVESLRLGSAALLLGGGSAETPLRWPVRRPGRPPSLPMRHRGEVVGTLRVTARPGRPG